MQDVIQSAFWDHVEQTDGCWVWTGRRSKNGYGRIHILSMNGYAHRFSYALHIEDPGRKFVLHSCHNRPCVRPDHLRAGTHRENMDDMFKRYPGRWSRLTDDQVRLVRLLRARGRMYREISDEVGCTISMAFHIVKGTRKAHVV